MIKISWIKSLYLWLIGFVSLVHFYRRRINVAYIMSFNNNLDLICKIAAAMPKDRRLMVFYTRTHLNPAAAKTLTQKGVQLIPFQNDLRFVFKTLPILLTAKIIFCDNYFPFLGGLILPKSVRVVQIWHADGAIKQFGWGDPQTRQRSKSAQRRFQRVYDSFDQYVVASRSMGRVFENDYHTSAAKMKLLGYPRSDRFFNRSWILRSRRQIYHRFPALQGHRVILYAPTYREGVTLRLPRHLVQALTVDPKARVIIKLHPALRKHFNVIKRRLGSVSRIKYLNSVPTDKLLTITDTLITDYSSVAFDFSLLPNARSMIFFTFDLAAYRRLPGCQPEFIKWLPGHSVSTVSALAQAIIRDRKTDFKRFNLRWNTYNDGDASSRFIDYYIKPLRRRN